MKKLYCLFLALFSLLQLQAQITLSTGIPNSTASNFGVPPYGITFTITNSNNYGITISNIDCYRGTESNNSSYSLYFNVTTLTGVTNINTSPGWNLITSTSVSTVASIAIHPTFTNISITIPANTTYRFMQLSSGPALVAGSGTATPNNFVNAGAIIGVGNYQINGANVGYAGGNGNLNSTPYSWAGTITFQPASTCITPPVAGTAIASNMFPCQGGITNLDLSNNTGGIGQSYQWQSSSAINGPYTNLGVSQAGAYLSTTAASTLYYRAFVTCSGNTDTSVPVLVTVPTPFPAGNYTINNAQPTGGSNFSSFAAAAAAINCGIAGPVVFNVSTGTYTNDHFKLDNNVNGPGKSITINGNGATILNGLSNAADPGIIRLNGTKKVTIDNLIIQGVTSSTVAATQSAWGIFMSNNADSNTITNCQIIMDTTSAATTIGGIILSGSPNQATTLGSGCDGIVITNNIIKGGYYGISIVGNTGANILQGNVISNNTIRDFYMYGIYTQYSNNMTVSNNDISRPTRTLIVNFFGIYLFTGHTKLMVSGNRVHDPATANPQASYQFNGIYLSGPATLNNENYIVNNIIYNVQSGGTSVLQGLYNNGAYARYLHNTVVFDYAPSTSTGLTLAYVQAAAGTAIHFKDNNIVITKGGTGVKYGLYMNSTTATPVSNNNNIYVLSLQGNDNIGYYGGQARISLASWQTASSQDMNSVTLDPMFANPSLGNFMPTNSALDNLGIPVSVLTDITGSPRSVTTPDMGAYEFAIPPCANTPSAGNASAPSSICAGISFILNLSGYTAGAGIGIQWQSSPAGAANFTNIPGATSPSTVIFQLAAMDYRALVTCQSGGGNSFSNIVSVALDSFFVCYCSPKTGNALHTNTGNFITNVSVANTSLNSSTTVVGTGGFTQSNYLIPSNTVTLTKTTPYVINVTVATPSYNVVGWIDYDKSGMFDASEVYFFGTTGTLASTQITIPTTAQTGLTGMRIRVYTTGSYGGNGACTSMTSGFETEDYVITIGAAPQCQQPGGFYISGLTPTTAFVNWGTVTGASGYEWAYSTSPTLPVSGTATAGTSASLGSLSPSTTYYFFSRTVCGAGFSLWSTYVFNTQAINDDPWNAIPITVGATCSGTPYTNLGGSQANGEPFPSCAGSNGYNTVWYSFIAPASGAVKISTDFSGGSMGADSRIALYSTTGLTSYNNYTILACDNDNGSTINERSVIYTTSITPNVQYYIQVDIFDPSQLTMNAAGTFCMEVQELNGSMIAPGGSCIVGQQSVNATGYLGSVSLVDPTSKLVANVVNTAGTAATYSSSLTKNTGPVRSTNGQYYLDRNFLINGPTSGNFNVQLFFTSAELSALQFAEPSATLPNMNVTRQSGNACLPNFIPGSGTNTGLSSVNNASANNANWVNVTTPGFSNFYIHTGFPLSIILSDITATNIGNKNRIDWKTGQEAIGDKIELERSSDAVNFTTLLRTEAKGEPSNYSVWDEKPINGVNYYRIKMTETTGKASYSKIVSTQLKVGGFYVAVFPNPVGDMFILKLNEEPGANATVQISDLTGKLVSTIPITRKEETISMKHFLQGIYLLKYSDGKYSQIEKLVKE